MIPNELLSLLSLSHRAYAKAMDGVCAHHNLTRMELAVLLFLASNPEYDTASELASARCVAKSHISTAINALMARGLITGEHRHGNRKTVHLALTDSAAAIIADGQETQQNLFAAMTAGLTEAQQELLHTTILRLVDNLRTSLE